jgi:tellurite resistance protein
MAARYAAIEGGLSATAYTGAIVATLGTLGGASPATVPAAIATIMVDVAFITQLQLRLAYDIAVLYRVPIDHTDPEDLWKLIRVAFTIKTGEALREGLAKGAPALVRPIVKKFFSGPVLTAAKGLPFVGKYLLQRNVLKVAIPAVGIPLSVALNLYSTSIAGRHARDVFRNEARVIELAKDLAQKSQHPQLLLWVTWLVVMADKKISDDEAMLMRHLVSAIREWHEVVDDQFSRLVDLDQDDVWRRLDDARGDLGGLFEAATRVASVDGPISAVEKNLLDEIETRCASKR